VLQQPAAVDGRLVEQHAAAAVKCTRATCSLFHSSLYKYIFAAGVTMQPRDVETSVRAMLLFAKVRSI
jgi:hypothetical protein